MLSSVAYLSLATFRTVVSAHGIDAERAGKIHNAARRVQKQAEQIVTSVVMDVASGALAKHKPGMFFASSAVAPATGSDTGGGALRNETKMSHCPAAYFVDLLRFLKTTSTPSQPTAEDASLATNTTAAPPPNSLLKKLFKQQLELRDLLLPCCNTSERVLYIDLINEIVGSAVIYLDKRADIGEGLAIDCYNTDDKQDFNYDIYAGST